MNYFIMDFSVKQTVAHFMAMEVVL